MVSPQQQQTLPDLIARQVERAMQRFITIMRGKGIRLTYKIKGQRVLIHEIMPHPQQKDEVLLPLALVDYKNEAWLLLFRTSNGHWQPVPDLAPTANIDVALNAIVNNGQGLF